MLRVFLVSLLCCCFMVIALASASVYQLPELNQRRIGERQIHQVVKGDYFQAIAEYYDVGFLALLEANPGQDPFLPAVGSALVIPTEMLLPFTKREGIVINLPELRLYYFPPNENLVYVFPVGVGRQGLETPRVTSFIGEKRKNPSWRPTKAMRERYFAEHQQAMTTEIPAGPNNPFGQYALRIGTSEYLLHGSNNRFGIGARVSSGCIRLYDEDIQWLYENVALNTPIRIVDQPIKMSYERPGHKLIEIHQPLTEEGVQNPAMTIPIAVQQFIGDNVHAEQQLQQLLLQPSGLVLEWTQDQ